MRIGILTGGGDCPGLNAVIRGLVLTGVKRYGYEFIGFRDGWAGPLNNLTMPLSPDIVRASFGEGGTMLGTSRTNPLKDPGAIDKLKANLAAEGLHVLVAIGGDDTLYPRQHSPLPYSRARGVRQLRSTLDDNRSGNRRRRHRRWGVDHSRPFYEYSR